MGLLDALFSGGNSGGGLLDFLKNNALNQQFPGMPQGDQAQYGQPMGAMAQAPIMPQQVPQQPPSVIQQQPMQQAQPPMPPQAQQPMPQQAPSPGGLGAGVSGFVNNLHTGPLGALIGGIGGAMGMQDPAAQIKAQQANMTALALKAKGIPDDAIAAAVGNGKLPGNPELLKTLISRAYPTEDKTPSGFATDDKGMHFVPGGPADPAYLRLKAAQEKDPNAVHVLGKGGELYTVDQKGNATVVHKNEEEGIPLTDDAVNLMADRAIAADPKALTNIGRGAQGRADLARINNAIAEKMKDNPNAAKQIQQNAAQQAGLVSASRALGTKETHFGVAEKAMEESIPLAQAASDAVPRTEWMHVNKLIQAGETEHSNPALKKFLIANDTAVKDYARTINPTGALRESDIEYARKTLSTADGPEAYTAGLAQLQMEAGVMHRAIQRQKSELQGGAGAPPAITGKTKSGVSWGLVR